MPFARSVEAFRPGDIKCFGASSLPPGWLWCDGSAVSRTTYAALFAAIGTAFGAGDGSTTFNVPDLRGRVPFGRDNMGGTAANRITTGGSGINGATLGAAGGGETVTLSTGQIPSHRHDLENGAAYRSNAGPNSATSGGGHGIEATQQLWVGGGGPHLNVPPALICHWAIKT